jgi:YD repeat-containing protein
MRALGVSFDTRPPVSKKFTSAVNAQLLQSEDDFNGAQRYAYDALGRVASARRHRPEYASLLHEATGAAPNQRQILENLFVGEDFRYDRAGNLFATTGAGEAGYVPMLKKRTVDSFGRGSGYDFPHVTHNRLEAIDDFTFTHDARGRVVEKRCDKRRVNWKYFYNSDNQLIEVNAFSSKGSVHTRFGYDALGRRVTSFDGRAETLFVSDGLRLLREERGTDAVTYFYEQGSFAPLARADGWNSFAKQQGKASSTGLKEIFYYHCSPAGLPEDV